MKPDNYYSKYNHPISDETKEMLEKLDFIEDWITEKYDNKKYSKS